MHQHQFTLQPLLVCYDYYIFTHFWAFFPVSFILGCFFFVFLLLLLLFFFYSYFSSLISLHFPFSPLISSLTLSYSCLSANWLCIRCSTSCPTSLCSTTNGSSASCCYFDRSSSSPSTTICFLSLERWEIKT